MALLTIAGILDDVTMSKPLPANVVSLISPVSFDQPNMRAALDHLQNAKRNLQSATADKGGHRQRAIDLVNMAIDEVNRGIAAAN